MDIKDIIVTDIKNVITVKSAAGRSDIMKKRRCYGLSFTAEGRITYTQRGINYVSDPSCAVILPKGQSYVIHRDISGEFPVINFECESFFTDTITVLPLSGLGAVMNSFTLMKKLFLAKENRLKIMSLFYEIISDISRTSDFSAPLFPAVEYIESNYFRDITNAELAQKCSISEVYFRKLFTKAYGISPRQYIINMRISRAEQMLTEGILKINAVSEQCGFSNPYHFCRLFKSRTGLTPSEFMKQNSSYKI